MKSKVLLLGAIAVFVLSCKKKPALEPWEQSLDFRQEMRDLVKAINSYADSLKPFFIVVPQNGQELVTVSGQQAGLPATDYLAAIDGQGREDLFYGYNGDDQPTPQTETDYMAGFLDVAKMMVKTILVTDYCSTPANVDDSYTQNSNRGYISFAADHRALDNIPAYPAAPVNENSNTVLHLMQVQNFLYLINPSAYGTPSAFAQAMAATNYDLVICDLLVNGQMLSANDVFNMKHKANGGQRLVLCYLSIGEAENYRYYWLSEWDKRKYRPSWIMEENPDWPGNFKVKYWDPQWQAILFGNDNSYVKKIVDAGFDGVYLDIVDAFEYFENLQ